MGAGSGLGRKNERLGFQISITINLVYAKCQGLRLKHERGKGSAKCIDSHVCISQVIIQSKLIATFPEFGQLFVNILSLNNF